MLTKEENERLTRVGPGAPMGTLMRYYWHPIAASAELVANPVKKVLILGESLVLYRDRSGGLGLIEDHCAHRATGLWYGIPDDGGLRCPYHGWKYDATGQCVDQPLEPANSTYKDRIKITAYPVEEMGGLIWAYLGPQPTPILPRWDQFVRPNTFRHIAATVLPCNWLQCMENGGDPQHGVWLHGHFYEYVLERMKAQGKPVQEEAFEFIKTTRDGWKEIRVEQFEHGQRKFVNHGGAHGDPEWVEHTIVLFPYLRGGQIGVPMDDTHTWHIIYMTFTPRSGVEVPEQKVVPFFDAPFADEKGEPLFDYITAQDHMAWWSQGEITDRTREHLAYTDSAIIEYRQLLQEQLDIVEEGGEPMNVFRDPAMKDRMLPMVPPRKEWSHTFDTRRVARTEQPRFITDTAQFSPAYDQLLDLYRRDREALAAARG